MKAEPSPELREFVLERKELTLEHKIHARKQIEELSKTGLGVERFPRENLCQALANSSYSRIDLGFLRQHNVSANQIRVPKFGIYTLDNPVMTLCLDRFAGEYRFTVHSPKDLPAIIRKQLIFSTDFGKDSHPERWHHHDKSSARYSGLFIPRKQRFNVKPMDYFLSSTFYGILPAQTKLEITEAVNIFGKNLFLVAQTRPEDWTFTKVPQPRIVEDPLIIGVMGEKAYLVDHFDTSPVEDYARREFTSS